MATPCPRCGTTKTESVRHGFIYYRLWNMGYHLRRCSFCNRKRLFKRHDLAQPHPNEMTSEELTEHFNRKIAQSMGQAQAVSEGEGEKMVANTGEESQEAADQPQAVSVGVADPADEVEDYRLCPKCGSTLYRRSRRRWYERLMSRPRMARCLKCDHRFPYPR